VTAGKLTMMKNTVDPLATQSGVLAALLARRGYTGPEHVIDGKEGLVKVFGPEWRLDVLTDGLGSDWRILRCGMKAFPTEALTHTPISAVLELVREHDLVPEIARVTIRSLARPPASWPTRPSTIPARRRLRITACYCIAAAPGPAGDPTSSRWADRTQ
jgi:2-methylcitrate dehydratase